MGPASHSSKAVQSGDPTGLRAALGTSLVRAVVPAWVLAGALFKLLEASPKTLPLATILTPANRLGLDLHVLLAAIIALEFLAAGGMLLVRRLAKPTAVFMLAAFCGVLVNEMHAGAASCGCFGARSPPLPLMMAIDGTLLLAVLALAPCPGPGGLAPARLLGALGFGAAGAALAFLVVVPRTPVLRAGDGGGPDRPQAATRTADGAAPSTSTADPARNPAPAPLPAAWMARDLEAEVLARPWRDFALFKLMPRWPSGLDSGKHYVIFYSRTCDHCQTLFQVVLLRPFDAPVHGVEIPPLKASQGGTPWDMPALPGVELLELPAGPDYIVTTPLVLTVEDGIVTCAQEGDYRRCLGVQ